MRRYWREACWLSCVCCISHCPRVHLETIKWPINELVAAFAFAYYWPDWGGGFYVFLHQDVLTGLTGPISGSRYTGSIYYSQWVCPTCVARDMKNRLLFLGPLSYDHKPPPLLCMLPLLLNVWQWQHFQNLGKKQQTDRELSINGKREPWLTFLKYNWTNGTNLNTTRPNVY